MPTMNTSVVSLNRPMVGVDDVRDGDLQRLRQDDEPHHLPVAEAERHGAPRTGPSGSPAGRRAPPRPCRPRRTARRRPARAAACPATRSSGTNSGSITLAMNSTVISGTPRTNSMKITENSRTAGMCERRPSASRMPIGSENTMPTADTTTVTSTPPHSVVVDLGQADQRPAEQQDERGDRHDDEEIDRAEIAARRLEPQQPDDADRQHARRTRRPASARRSDRSRR